MRFRVYEPLRTEPALFRKFAELYEAGESRILDFANRYGGLSHEPEFYGSWSQSAGLMDSNLGYWDRYRDGGWNEADDLDHTFRTYFLNEIFSDENAKEREQVGMPPLPDRDHLTLPQAALLTVQSAINHELGIDGATPRLMYEQGPDRLGLRIVPKSLHAALWLQFASAVDGERDYRRCRSCRQWFQITYDNTGRRRTRVYCSNACRSRGYRGRIEEARELFVAGTSLVDISDRLGCDVDSVRQWVKTSGKPPARRKS